MTTSRLYVIRRGGSVWQPDDAAVLPRQHRSHRAREDRNCSRDRLARLVARRPHLERGLTHRNARDPIGANITFNLGQEFRCSSDRTAAYPLILPASGWALPDSTRGIVHVKEACRTGS